MTSGESISVRLAARDDLPRLHSIEQAASRAPWSFPLFAAEFDNRFSRTYAACRGGRIEGFGVLHVVLDEAHVVNLAVDPQLQGQRIGTRLLSVVLARLVREGVRWAYLEARESNAIALRLYENLGFRKVALRRGYYSDNGESAVLLNLDLSRAVLLDDAAPACAAAHGAAAQRRILAGEGLRLP